MSKKTTFKGLLIQLLMVVGITLISLGATKVIIDQQTKGFVQKQEIIIADILKNQDVDAKQLVISFTDPSITKDDVDSVLLNHNIRAVSLYEDFGVSQQQQKLLFLVPLLVFIASVFMVFITSIIKRYYDRRLAKLNHNVNQALNNDFSINLSDYLEDDISSLETDVYKIITKLKSMGQFTLSEKKKLEDNLSDISHQLKTPLTSMFVINDIMLQDKLDSKERREFLLKNRKQLERVEWLIKSILKMSQIDSGTIIFKKEASDILELVKSVANDLSIPLELKDINLKIEVEEAIVAIDFEWTKEAVMNILKNAIEYSEVGGSIEIYDEQTPLYHKLYIKDHGAGMSKDQMKRVFERFYKGNQNSDSIGIGLNMSKTIIERQYGDIQVLSEEGQGTTFIISLPY